MASRRVAACVVTGFLGSGKTTLLRGLLDRDPGRDRIAVVVNEIGEIGMDGRALSGFEFVENVVELASGCVCCSIDEYRFDLAIDELVRRVDPVLVVIETSGVADPAPTLERLRRCGLGVDAVVTVVDANAWQHAWRVSRVARRQIGAADFLVISKADLVPPRTLARLRARLVRSNPRALVLEGRGAAPFEGADLLLATTAARRAHRLEGRPAQDVPDARDEERAGDPAPGTDHLVDERIESFSWRTARPVDRRALEAALRDLPADVWRAKGIARGADERHAWLFQVVCGRVEMSAFEGDLAAGAQGVFIGRSLGGHRDGILARLAECEQTAGSGPEGGAAGASPARAG